MPDGIADIKRPYTSAHADALKAEIVTVTPTIARIMRDTMHFERQRPIADVNVTRLKSEMQAGTFIAGTPIFICVTPDDKMWIVNGNHTLEAVHAAGVSVPLAVIYKRVSSLDEAGMVYANLDIQRVRSYKNALQATGAGDGVAWAEKLMAAVAIIIDDFRAYGAADALSSSRTRRIEAMQEYKEAANLIASSCHGHDRSNVRQIQRRQPLAVAVYTARYQPNAATEFWGGMAADDALSRDDPRKAFLSYARNNPAAAGQSGKALLHGAIQCWNAFFEGRTLMTGSVLGNSARWQFRIAGTPRHRGVRPDESFGPVQRPLFSTGIKVSANGHLPVAEFVG